MSSLQAERIRAAALVRTSHWHQRLASLLLALLGAITINNSHAQSELRVGVLKFGTVNWELDAVSHHGLAAKHGVNLQVVPLASKRATDVALQGGAVDLIVSDWIWVSRQRADGRNYTFVPYSLAVGAMMVDPQAGINKLTDLTQRRVGIAGGPVDKSWLLMRAYTRQQTGKDLAELVTPNFAAPPLLNQLMIRGELSAVLNYWHYNARLAALGMKPLVSVKQALRSLGVQTPLPLLGWVFSEQWADANREVLNGFLTASYAAKHLLLRSDQEWRRLRPRLKTDDEATAHALRDAYREGIPNGFGAAERDGAKRAFELLAREGGSDLVGSSGTLSEGTFWPHFTVPRWPK